MDELVEWLTACLNEMEGAAVAGSASDRTEWEARGLGVLAYGPSVLSPYTGRREQGRPAEVINDDHGGSCRSHEVAAHIALHDPRAVLARVEAERALVLDHLGMGDTGGWCERCDGERLPCHVIEYLAYGHRYDYPGYREEWAPEVATSPGAAR